MQAASAAMGFKNQGFNVTGVTGIIPDCTVDTRKLLEFDIFFSYSPTDDDLEKEFPFSSMSILWCPYTILADLMSNQMDPPWTKQQIAAWNIPVILKTLQLCFNSQIAIINHFISFPHFVFQGRHKLCKLQLELHQRPTTKCYPESSLPGLTILGIADTQPKPKA